MSGRISQIRRLCGIAVLPECGENVGTAAFLDTAHVANVVGQAGEPR
jgi:hypothetical protein